MAPESRLSRSRIPPQDSVHTLKKSRLTSPEVEVEQDEKSGMLEGPRIRRTVVNDEWQTTEKSWGAIAPFFKAFRTRGIWMPFYYDGECGKHLRKCGFKNVFHTNEDFFTRLTDVSFMKTVDLIWDNPPYTGAVLKTRIFESLVACGKPFVMLLPSSVLHSKMLQDLLDPQHIQCIIPRRVEVRKTNQDPVPFKYLVWLCYKTSLDRDLLFV